MILPEHSKKYNVDMNIVEDFCHGYFSIIQSIWTTKKQNNETG